MKTITKWFVGAASGAGVLLQVPAVQNALSTLLQSALAKHAVLATLAGIVVAAVVHDPKAPQ